MSQFVGYYIEAPDDAAPVATGADREKVMAKTIHRVLAQGWLSGEIAVRQRDDLDADLFTRLGGFLDKWFSERGIA